MHSSLATPVLIAFGMIANMAYAQDSRSDSPQVVFESYRTALERDDWNSLYSTLSPGYRDYMIFESVFAMGVGAPCDEANAIIEKYVDKAKFEKLNTAFTQQPTTEQCIATYSQAIENKKGMFLDCSKYFEQKGKKNPDANKPKFGPLVGLVINENVAFAKCSVTFTIVFYSRTVGDAKDVRHEQETTTDTPCYFIKSDEKWLFSTQTEWQKHNAKDADK